MRCLVLVVIITLLPRQAEPQGIDLSGKPFTADARVISEDLVGGTLNGVRYWYGRRGLGFVASRPDGNLSDKDTWDIECENDVIEDVVSCALSREHIMVVLREPGGVALIIGGNHYPGSQVAIRVDEEKPFKSHVGFAGAIASQILDLMAQGKKVITRYQEWPNQANVDSSMELYGFNEALQLLRWAVTRYE